MVEKINAIYDSTVLKGFVVRPGHENLVAMTAVNTIADEAIRDVLPEKRNCYFQDEYKLDMYQLYSQSGCIFECKMRIGQSKTEGGCTPWFYPTRGELSPVDYQNKLTYITNIVSDSNMCDPWQTQVFLSAVMDGGSGEKKKPSYDMSL